MSKISNNLNKITNFEDAENSASVTYSKYYVPLEDTSKRRENITKKVDNLDNKITKTQEKILVYDGMKIFIDTGKSWADSGIAILNSIKSKFEKRLVEAQLENNLTKISVLQHRIAKIEEKIQKKLKIKLILESRLQKLESKSQTLSSSLSQLSAQKVEAGSKAKLLLQKEELLTKRVLKAQDKFDRNNSKKEFAKLVVDSKQCICPMVYNPIVIDGVTYGNACIAACNGKTIPENPDPPTKPPIGDRPRICKMVITCGSDGNTYPDSCLPHGVFPVQYGKSCSDINFIASNSTKPSPNRPPVKISTTKLLNITNLPKICGSNNITYNTLNDLPSGVTVSYLGTCIPIE